MYCLGFIINLKNLGIQYGALSLVCLPFKAKCFKGNKPKQTNSHCTTRFESISLFTIYLKHESLAEIWIVVCSQRRSCWVLQHRASPQRIRHWIVRTLCNVLRLASFSHLWSPGAFFSLTHQRDVPKQNMQQIRRSCNAIQYSRKNSKGTKRWPNVSIQDRKPESSKLLFQEGKSIFKRQIHIPCHACVVTLPKQQAQKLSVVYPNMCCLKIIFKHGLGIQEICWIMHPLVFDVLLSKISVLTCSQKKKACRWQHTTVKKKSER